jgi:hypothetical protein
MSPPCASSDPRKELPAVFHETAPDELAENEMLTLPGEDLDAAAEDDDGFTVPCRYLDDFVVYDLRRNNQLVAIESIEDDTAELRASGLFFI